MNVALFHSSLTPVFYGVMIFLGLLSMYWKFTHGRWAALITEVSVFVLVFKLHGGTMEGGFAATIAALLAGLFFPYFMGRKT